jgi:hypothetical protein
MHRLSTWLCLLVALFEGFTAGRALVVCVEPGGSVSFEAALAGAACDGCTGSQSLAQPSEPGAMPAESVCPCIDVALDLSTNGARAPHAGARWSMGLAAAIPAPPVMLAACGGARPFLDELHSAGAVAAGPALIGIVILVV